MRNKDVLEEERKEKEKNTGERKEREEGGGEKLIFLPLILFFYIYIHYFSHISVLGRKGKGNDDGERETEEGEREEGKDMRSFDLLLTSFRSIFTASFKYQCLGMEGTK